MEYLCVICLTTVTNPEDIGDRCRQSYFSDFYDIYNRCNNHICQKCNKYYKFNRYPVMFQSYRYAIPLCSDNCASYYFSHMNFDNLSDDNPLLLQQKDIRNSILLYLRTSVNNYMINDLTNIVIEYLV